MCAESGDTWRSSRDAGHDVALRETRASLVRRAEEAYGTAEQRLRAAKASALAESESGASGAAAQALRGEYERALSLLDGLRAEATALASATDGVLRAEPCAMALLEWWAAHTNACYTAYGGMRHADAAVEEAVEAQAADARLTLGATTGEMRALLEQQHTPAASAAQWPLDSALEAAAAVASGAGGSSTPAAERGGTRDRVELPPPPTAAERKRTRIARRVVRARRARAQYLAKLEAAAGAAAAAAQSLDPAGKHATATFQAMLAPPAEKRQPEPKAERMPPPPPPRPGAAVAIDGVGAAATILQALSLNVRSHQSHRRELPRP